MVRAREATDVQATAHLLLRELQQRSSHRRRAALSKSVSHMVDTAPTDRTSAAAPAVARFLAFQALVGTEGVVSMDAPSVSVEFSGGLELLLRDKTAPTFRVQLPKHPMVMREMLTHLRDTVIAERPELFVSEGSVCVARGGRRGRPFHQPGALTDGPVYWY